MGDDWIEKNETCQKPRMEQGYIGESIGSEGVADTDKRWWWAESVDDVNNVTRVVKPTC